MYVIRPFNPFVAEYEAVVAVHNACWPEEPELVSTWQHNDGERPPERLFQRFVLEQEGKIVAYSYCREGIWVYSPGKYFLDIDVHPGYAGSKLDAMLYDHMLDFLCKRKPEPTSLVGYAREDKTTRVQFWLDRGFQQTMRYPMSELDLANFDHSRFVDVLPNVAQQGITIQRLTELRKQDPNWMAKLYELHWAILQDVPIPHELTRAPLEEFAKDFEHPSFNPDSWFIAIDPASAAAAENGHYVGLSYLWINPANHKKLETGLTGVLRSHRRKGLALAMKLHVIRFAQEFGAEVIETENEENNPMYNINMLLGFQPRPAWLDFLKKMEE